MKFNKINKEEGSALVLVIIAMALVSLVIMNISSQINNQVKFNDKSYKDMQYKYLAEAGIEESISEIISQINNKNEKVTLKEYLFFIDSESSNIEKMKLSQQNNIDIEGKDEVMFDIISHGGIKEHKEKKYTITAEVKFIINDLNNIKYEIISYEHKRN